MENDSLSTVSKEPNNKTLSRDVSTYLDELGFSRTERWMRIRDMNIDTKLLDMSIKYSIKTNNERIRIGSIREGLGFLRVSDLDVLQVDHNFICTKSTLSPTPRDKIILKLIDTDTPPGYCRLQLDNLYSDSKILEKYKYACVEKDDQTYLSSKMFVTVLNDDITKVSGYAKGATHYQEQHGPSTPKCITSEKSFFWKTLLQMTCAPDFIPELIYIYEQQCDFVIALPCEGNTTLNVWAERTRYYNWPSEKLIKHIMYLPVYVVPVGQKGSVDEDCEWRVSFVQAEIMLVKSFNNVQSKIYVMLKLCAKHYLKTDTDIISSYVIKNVMFWFAETVPQRKFRQKHLITRMIDALQMLKESVVTKTLHCYMQPERNLLASRINDVEQQILLYRINNMLNAGHVYLYDIVYNEQPSVTTIRKIVDTLILYKYMHIVGVCFSSEWDLSTRLYDDMVYHQLSIAEERLLYGIICSKWKVGLMFANGHVCDKHYSRCLIEAEKDMRTRTTEEIINKSLNSHLALQIIFIRMLAFFPRLLVSLLGLVLRIYNYCTSLLVFIRLIVLVSIVLYANVCCFVYNTLLTPYVIVPQSTEKQMYLYH